MAYREFTPEYLPTGCQYESQGRDIIEKAQQFYQKGISDWAQLKTYFDEIKIAKKNNFLSFCDYFYWIKNIYHVPLKGMLTKYKFMTKFNF